MKFFILLAVLTFSFHSQARKINMATLGATAFFRFGGGLQNTGASFYDQSSGGNTRFSEDVPYHYSGELGFHYSLTPDLGFRLGAEFVQSQDAKVEGKGTDGTKYMEVRSSSFAFNPNAALEMTMAMGRYHKVFVFLGAGLSNLKVTNDTRLTSAGSTQYGGVSDYKEAVEGTGLMYNAGVGFQYLALDEVSTVFELGYRELHIRDLEYSQDITNIQGAQLEGGTALAYDGTQRQAKLGGLYVTIAFRFHFPQFN